MVAGRSALVWVAPPGHAQGITHQLRWRGVVHLRRFIIPLLLIYRKYYGTAMALCIFAAFYAAMAAAGYVSELVFGPLGLVPDERTAKVVESSVSWNYTTWLNIVFLVLAFALVWRFVRTGGVPMLRMMGGSPKPSEPRVN
jgi:uncharacterized membrane protein YraQ (UPF0718 family)